MLLLAGAPAAAHTQYLQRYKDGIKALETRDWVAAAAAFKDAIDERPEEKGSLPLRGYTKPYLPYYQLGVARFELGDCAGALEAWRESERQGVVTGRSEITEVRRRRGECERRSRDQSLAAKATADAAAAAGALAEAERAASALEKMLGAGGVALTREARAPLESRRRTAEERLQRSRERLAAGRAGSDSGAFADAEALARDANRELEALRLEAVRLGEEQAAQAGARRDAVDTLTTDARALLARTAKLASTGRQLRRARADLEGLLAERDRAAAAGDEANFEGLASRLSFSMATLEQLATPPPPLLLDAARALLRGEYARVTEILSGSPSGDARTRAHAYLLRAAARYNLWVEGGEKDEALIAAAAADVVESRRDLTLTPAPAFLSPRFRAFFETGGVSPAADGE